MKNGKSETRQRRSRHQFLVLDAVGAASIQGKMEMKAFNSIIARKQPTLFTDFLTHVVIVGDRKQNAD
jgi:hypothetical protein